MKERLYRSRIDRVLGGVASGLSRYMNLDPILVRIIFIILAFFNGIGILLYIIMWIVVPEDPTVYGFQGKTDFQPESGGSSKSKSKKSQESKAETSGSSPNFEMPPFPQPKKNGSGRIVAGVIFIGLGFIFLADRIFPYFEFEDFIPLLLVIIGIALLWNSLKK